MHHPKSSDRIPIRGGYDVSATTILRSPTARLRTQDKMQRSIFFLSTTQEAPDILAPKSIKPKAEKSRSPKGWHLLPV